MHSGRVIAVLAGLLSVILAAGCVTRYEPPEASAAHAIIAFPSQAEQWDASLFIEPVEFNGVPRPQDWMREHFRVPPGELRLRVRAAKENLQATCVLSFPVEEGETYTVDATSLPGEFAIRASLDGHAIATCDSPKTLLPTPPGPPPGTPPR